MASYWHSIGAMLQGSGSDIEPRRRSRYEPDAGDPQGFAADAGEDQLPDDKTVEPAPKVQSPRLESNRSDAANDSSAVWNKTPPHEASKVAQPELRGEHEATETVPTAAPVQASAVPKPMPDAETDVPRSMPVAEREQSDEPPIKETSPTDLTAHEAIEDVAKPAKKAELSIAQHALVTDEGGEPEDAAPADAETTDLPVIAELREEFAAVVRAELSTEPENHPADSPSSHEAPLPQPIVVEIDHIAIEIARPSVPPPANRRSARNKSQPVISLDEFLDRSGGGAA